MTAQVKAKHTQSPAPDNGGLDKEKPKNVNEEAAKVNRDTDKLQESATRNDVEKE